MHFDQNVMVFISSVMMLSTYLELLLVVKYFKNVKEFLRSINIFGLQENIFRSSNY